MHSFNYRSANSLEDSVSSLAAASDGALLAGGMTLIPTLKLRLASPSDLISIRAINGLSGVCEERGAVVIGAHHLPRRRSVGMALVRSRIPALAALAGGIGDPQVRNRGTIGGSIANNDPAADYPARACRPRRNGADQQARDRGGRLLYRPVRDRFGGRRNHHRGFLPGAGQGGLPEVREPAPRAMPLSA